ncbi:type II toxin-antitoxin system Phd/YefM family antitoxin [Pendulispora albinea]|uniref:Antitoxin n=1 Tax=Pendulispora albinea TaxID=2741071 RepID=A0ABZ2LNE6_9BACT
MSKIPRLWQIQDAKNRLSEVVDNARQYGPQVITRRGKETAVVLSYEQYTRLTEPKERFIDLLRKAPRSPDGLVTERSKDTGRKIDL